ncbi:hypothetical protein [Pseudozobellia sp. WGM2]|uniref:hypothetical protein n=1 Tax=Pseudozobellia sp. WGM2 TaxID=2787625 RepID=UPI001ADFFB80|nr:hypothetical protein [Pseudozobellia sp. WGM2]
MAGSHGNWFHSSGCIASVFKGAVKTGVKVGAKSLAKGAAKEGSKYLYHYTSKKAAQSISQQGLKVGRDGFSYLTNKGNLSPLQA